MIPIIVKHFMCLGLGGALVSTLATMFFCRTIYNHNLHVLFSQEDNDVLCPYV
jgi:hypothetical protein